MGNCGRTVWPALVVLLFTLSSCGTSTELGPTIHVQNLDGPPAKVVPWEGAQAVAVNCGTNKTISPDGAPPLPWSLTVYDTSSGSVLFTHSVTGTLYLIIRAGGVLWGDEPGSGGPAPKGCP